MNAYAHNLQHPSQHLPVRDSAFLQLTRTFLKATEWISLTTGETLSFSASEKLMWVWMKDRHDFFKGRGQSWYDNQDDIAAATGTSVATVKRWLAKLEKHGYLERGSRGLSNNYTIKADLKLSLIPSESPSPKPSSMAGIVPLRSGYITLASNYDDDLPPPPF